MSNYDERLDLWIETKLLRRARTKRVTVPKYTRYTNTALRVLSDLEMPFTLRRREDLKYELSVLGFVTLANCWDDLASVISQTLYRVVEGTSWIHHDETLSHAEENC